MKKIAREAEEYANERYVHKFMRDVAQKAFIAGSKSGYIDGSNAAWDITGKEFDADEFAPEIIGGGEQSCEVVCVDHSEEIFYDYGEERWFNYKGVPASPTKWRYPKPIKLEDEREEETDPKARLVDAIENYKNTLHKEYVLSIPKDSVKNLLSQILTEIEKL